MKYMTLFLAAVLLFFGTGCSDQPQHVQKPSTGIMNFTSDPDGAEITIMGKNIGVTPRKTNPVPPSLYIVKFSREGYETRWIPVNLHAGEEANIHAVLQPLKSLAMITSTPSGATVIRNGQSVGLTPCVLTGLQAGPQSVLVTMPGFSSREITWSVTGDRPFAGHVSLLSNTGTLQVQSQPSEANVFIDNKAYGQTPVNETVEQGNHQIRVELDGYKPYTTEVTVKRNETASVKADLTILPMTLTVRSTPVSAEVRINGKAYGMTPYKFETSVPGKYKVEVSKDHFSGTAQEITLVPGSKSEVELTLSSELGAIEFVTLPGVVEVFFDGKRHGYTKQDPNKPNYSLVYRIQNVSAGKHKVEIIHKRGVPAKRVTIPCHVLKRQTTRLENVQLWVPNVILILKNGMRQEGRIMDLKSDPLIFEPRPGIRVEYPLKEVRSTEIIKDKDEMN